nr:MAG TPA_asm: hypothetical protein [Caudoviricetes sp.]
MRPRENHLRTHLRKNGYITKKPPFGGFTTLLIALIILCFPWYPEWDLNPHSANAEGF